MNKQFICVKWGSKYPAEYVNRLYRMIRKQVGGDFVLYCLTDDESDLYEDIKVLPVVDASLSGWWHKLSLFKEDFYGLSGDILYMDLDVVIVGSLDEFFMYKKGKFLISRDLLTGAYNSSVFRFNLGSQSQIWESFIAGPDDVTRNYKGDQDWITRMVEQEGLWPEQWVVSFKKQCKSRIKHSYGIVGKYMRKMGLMTIRGEAIIPEGARIVQFHGKPDPEDVVDGPYDIYKCAPWIRKYWL
jgi:hypothetical protein